MNAEAPTQFDRASYRDWRRTVLGRTTDALEQELIFEVIGDVAGLKILDVGCGDGELAVGF